MEVEAILLDMDGLMVDSEPLWFEVERALVRKHGGEWTNEHAHACTGQGLSHTIKLMGELLGCALDENACRAELHDAFHAGVGRLKLHAGCIELLEEARGRVKLAVASSSSRRLVLAVLDATGIRDRFDAVVTGSDVKRLKPAPDIFLEAASRVGVDPDRCVVLEDSLAGVRAGRAAGMRVIAVPERLHDRFASEADHVVRDLFEARALLRFR